VIVVKQDTRLNSRILDLRIPTNIAIMKVVSQTCHLFRDYLLKKDFIEIHTPKLIGG
jgi:aspartyl-tRNA synthetase